MMDGDDNEEETYIEHLRSMFNQLDPDRKGGLSKNELRSLSEKLSLQKNQSDLLLQLSFANEDCQFDLDTSDDKECVDFNKFQESFVAVLSVTADMQSSNSDPECEIESKVEPRLVRGGRSYGRKSQPDIPNFDIDDNEIIHKPDIGTTQDEVASDSEDVFDSEFYELPERGDGDKIYFEASGQLRNPALDRLRPKSTSTVLNDSQLNISSTSSILLQTQHLFTELDKNDIGLIDFADLQEMWKREGVANPQHVLQLLDVSIDSDKQVNAIDLTSTLENEAASLRLSTVDSVTQAVLATYKCQLAYLNGQIEQHQVLLGKMKDDLEKSEIRNSKLIDEVDDRYLHVDKNREKLLHNLEQQWSRKLRQAQRTFDNDRELFQTDAMLERDALQQEIDRLMIREGSLRSTIDALQMDNDALEQESKDLVKKLQMSESNSARLQRDLENLIKEKASSSHDSFNSSQEEKFALIIKDYEAQCRSLSDRNDELVAELEKSRMEFLQYMRKKPQDENDNEKSSSRKRARRRGSIDYIEKPGMDGTDESDVDGEEMRLELCNKISDMEKTIQKLEEERTILTTRFTEEKSHLQSQLESEYRNKLEEEKKKLTSFEEMTKSEKNTAINQALADGRKQKEDLEKKITELQKSLEDEALKSAQSITDLCREFENDKMEIQKNHEEFTHELQDEVSDLQQQLEKEIEAHEMTSQQLKNERNQHKSSMQAHSEAVKSLESNAKRNNSDEKEEIGQLKSRLNKLAEENEKLEKDKQTMQTNHDMAVEMIKTEMQTKIEDMIADKQKQERSSLCNELDRMHENVADERKLMQERINNLKETFDAEADELRTLVELEKCELRKALAEESAALKKKLADEHKKAAEKKKRQLEEEERGERESQINHLEEIIKNLREAKIDLEEQLRHSIEEKRDIEKENTNLKFEKETSSKTSQLEHVLEEKDRLNEILQSQISELRLKHHEVSQELLQVKTQYDAKNAEIGQVVKEKQQYAGKIMELENEKSSMQLQNARLFSKNIELGKSEAEIKSEENEKKMSQLRDQLSEREEICSQLQEKLKKFQSLDDSPKLLSKEDPQTRFEHARHQLIQQMNKTKEMYSKLARSESLIKDLYCENAELMRALQLTEERYKSSERKIIVENEKNVALTSLLHKICPEAV
uniref:ninein-like protein n=1 Tax=Styela clava TaxID=7725 RepID=UPI0019395B54|nr:ninein-like protein [Styela clava]